MRAPAPLTIKASSSQSIRLAPLPPVKIVRVPALDRRAAKHSKLRFVRKLKTASFQTQALPPLRPLPLSSLPEPSPSHSLLKMIKRYPASSASSTLHPTPPLFPSFCHSHSAAAALAADEVNLRARLADALATKLQRLLMLAPRHSLLLSKLVHLAPDLGLAPNFRSRSAMPTPPASALSTPPTAELEARRHRSLHRCTPPLSAPSKTPATSNH
ncbi:hypothetical protein HPP92_022968 [Vanilla planifolia]|uniref:PORR domain-containing protein n=1 Tax=Vanilla planifolia TaxID=51239 RepID=A0A835UG17_VANPL|nr:hypothetical protein HPP92_023208 [Vanilla planifolia]KAG0459840.1 hypothetical protein HPP92_022968 [Vanilla planifolia]